MKRRRAACRSRSCHDHEVRYSMSNLLALTQAQCACQSGYASSHHTALLMPCTDHIQAFGAHDNSPPMVSPKRATMPSPIMASEVPLMASKFCLCSVCQGRWPSLCRCRCQPSCRAERDIVLWKAKLKPTASSLQFGTLDVFVCSMASYSALQEFTRICDYGLRRERSSSATYTELNGGILAGEGTLCQ